MTDQAGAPLTDRVMVMCPVQTPVGARLATLLLAALALATAACGPAERAGTDEGVLRSDSAGVEIVTSLRPVWIEGEGWRVGDTPNLELGAREGSPEQTLHGITAVRRRGDTILVAQETELRLYGGDGSMIGTRGGPGQGPGEFGYVYSADFCGEGLVGSERIPPALVIFDAAGVPSTVPLPPPSNGRFTPMAVDGCADGAVLGRMSGVAVRVDVATALIDTIHRYPGVRVHDGLIIPFTPSTQVVTRDSLVHRVDTGSPEVRVYGHDGRLRSILRMTAEPRDVTSDDVSRIREQYLDVPIPSVREEVRGRLDAVEIPSTMPFFSELQVADDGTVWLRDYQPFRAEPVTSWTVLAADGRWLGRVMLHDGFIAHAFAEDEVIGVWRDEMDVEYVRVYPIHGTEGG